MDDRGRPGLERSGFDRNDLVGVTRPCIHANAGFREAFAIHDALRGVMRPVAFDRERRLQGTEGRIRNPLREVELLDLRLSFPGELGSEIPDFGRDATDTRGADTGVD